MVQVDSADVFFMSLLKQDDLPLEDITSRCRDVLEKTGVISPIDFKYYAGKMYSEKLHDEIWFGMSAGLLEQTSDDTYVLTEYGRKIVGNYYMKIFRDKHPDAYERLDEEFEKAIA